MVSDANALYFVARDVTDSNAALTQLEQDASVMQAVLESVADGLYVADSQGEMTFINPAGVQLLGYESADELIGRSPHAAFHHTHPDGRLPIEDCPLAKVRITGERDPCRRGWILAQRRLGDAGVLFLGARAAARRDGQRGRVSRHHRTPDP